MSETETVHPEPPKEPVTAAEVEALAGAFPRLLADYLPAGLAVVIEAALSSLRDYVEDPAKTEVTWANPWVEARLVAPDYNWDHPDEDIFSLRLLLDTKDRKAVVRAWMEGGPWAIQSHALYVLTHRAHWRTRGGTSTLYLPPEEVARLAALPDAERQEAEHALVEPVTFGAFALDVDVPEEGPVSPELAAALQAGLDACRPGLAFEGTTETGEPFSGRVVLQFHPLEVDADARDAFFPVVVGLVFDPREEDLAENGELRFPLVETWSEADRTAFWDALIGGWRTHKEALLAKVLDRPAEAQPADTTAPLPTSQDFGGYFDHNAHFGQTFLTPPPPVVPVPAERRRSVMSPVPMPRAMTHDADALRLTRGLSRMFAGYAKVPNLDVDSEAACREAESLFWDALEDTLNRRAPGWTRTDADGRTTLTLPVAVPEASALWQGFTKGLNAGGDGKTEEKGPGIEVAAPAFENRTHLNSSREVVTETRMVLWPEDALCNRHGEKVPAVKFRRESSPGYVDLLSRHGPRPFFADGWLWIPRGNEREGFRLGGLSTLLFPEGRVALERLKRREETDLEKHLQRIFRNPSLFRDEDARAIRDLQAAIRRVKDWLSTLSVYDIGPDLLLCIFEAFHRQRDAWVNERLALPDGREVETRPWRVIRLDPQDLRVRLDPGKRWGRNWRDRLFEKLVALTTFERQTRTHKGKKVDVGDRFLLRVLDGRRGVDEGTAPDTDTGLGLTRLLKRAKVWPVDTFFAEVSVDFLERLVTWAVNEKGRVRWGLDAAKAAEQKALTDGKDAQDARAVRRTLEDKSRGQPTYDHSPRVLTLGNLEEWPETRKLLAYTLLAEQTPHFERYRDARGISRKRHRPNRRGGSHALVTFAGEDYVPCNGKHGYGYRVAVWVAKVGYERRTGPGGGTRAFRAFFADLRALVGGLGLRLELGPDGLRDTAALDAISTYTGRRRASRGERPDPPPETLFAGNLKLKVYLPADLEDRLRVRLAEEGIDALDQDEVPARTILTPSRPGGLTPAAVRLARKKAGWKQAELAEKVGVSQQAVAYWEAAKKPIPPDREDRLRKVLASFLESPD